jgi:alginate O-acetyltransferase complex protein AlgI
LTHSLSLGTLAEGVTLFTIGLFKKLVMADTLAACADPVFNAASSGGRPGMIEAWGGVLAYCFQLYFDFSGYTAWVAHAAIWPPG